MYWKHLGLSMILASAGFFAVPYHVLAQDPLIVANARVSAVDDRSATIQWSTNYAARGRVEYGKSASYGQSYGFEGEPRISHALTLSNLAADTTYHFRVIAATGFEEAKSFDQTFTTAKTIDRDTPIVTDVAIPYQLSNLAVIQWRTSEASDSQVLFGPTTSYGSQANDSAQVTVHDIVVTGLRPLTTYHFQVKSKDNGNNTGVSTDYTFRTTSDSYGRPPLELINIRPVAANDPDITDTSATVSWRTTILADGIVRWGTTDGLGLTAQSPPPRDFFHTAKLVNLQPATTYYFQVESKDVFGVSIRSPIFTFITKGGYSTPLPGTGRVAGVSTGYDLMFYNSFDRGLNADFSLGNSAAGQFGTPRLTQPGGGAKGQAADLSDGSMLAFDGWNNINPDAGTISFWFKPNWNGNDGIHHVLFMNNSNYQVDSDKYLMIGKTGSSGIHTINSDEGNRLYLGLEDSQDNDYRYYVHDLELTADRWYFVAVTWSYFGGYGKVYVNGKPATVKNYSNASTAKTALGQTPNNLFTSFYVGSLVNDYFNVNNGDTLVDELNIFGRDLSGQEINYIYTQGIGRYLKKPKVTPTPQPTGHVLGVSLSQYTPATVLLRAKGEPDVYAIMNGQKHLISGPNSFAAYGYRWSDVRVVSRDVLEKFPDARLVRTPSDPAVYYLYLREQRQWLKLGIPSPTVFVSYPNNFWGNIITINEIDLASYPDVELIRSDESATVYLLEKGAKREITSDALFDALQLPRSNIAQVNRIHLDFYPNGKPLTSPLAASTVSTSDQHAITR